MTAPRPTIDKATAEWDPADEVWMLMCPDGSVTAHRTPKGVLAGLRAYHQRHGTGFDVTVLDWTNVPAGFVPPRAQP